MTTDWQFDTAPGLQKPGRWLRWRTLWGVHCMVNELLRLILSDAKWSDLLGQLHRGMLCYIPDTPLSVTERLAGAHSWGYTFFKEDNTRLELEAFCLQRWRSHECWVHVEDGFKGKEELFVPGAPKTGEKNESEDGGRAIMKNHSGSLVARHWFLG